MLTVKAVRPDDPYQQTTEYVYGALTIYGNDLNSADLLVLVKHPDKTTGQPSDPRLD